MAQRCRLGRSGGERKAGGPLRGPGVAEGHEQGKAVQPRTVQVTEGGGKRGLVVRRA
jgi:hypothetical protein